jgi:soluble lytic murein transglycosylase-like protein
MPARKIKKITTVHTHPMHIPPSKKHPSGGMTIRHQHPRRIYTSYDSNELRQIAKKYDINKTPKPTPNDLGFSNGNKFDKIIAIWVDYFNKTFPPSPPFAPLDPDVIKALIASESGFNPSSQNQKAKGIAQITPETLKALQNPNGELKDHLFKDILQKDLNDPEIAIPLATRWIFQKKYLVEQKLKRAATNEEIIMAYKGILNSRSELKESELKAFKRIYNEIKK